MNIYKCTYRKGETAMTQPLGMTLQWHEQEKK